MLIVNTLSFSAYQVNKRHEFLEQLIGVKEEEVTSYEHMHSCLVAVTACICSFSVLEVLAYFLYLFKVKQLKLNLISEFILILSSTHGSILFYRKSQFQAAEQQ